ncbi:MAG: hypothetical protein KF745_14135 [Phycisphaeraceae bacterium]|nr:hypothetical protein [Phycisphaeraceae bacterium]
MTDTAAPPPPPGVSSHQRCAKCKYPLRGLAPDAPCPECGSTERESPVSRPPPRWLWLWALPMVVFVTGFAVQYFGKGERWGMLIPPVFAVGSMLVTAGTAVLTRSFREKGIILATALGTGGVTFVAGYFALAARFVGW